MKTKSPKCPICNKTMEVIYTKKSYVIDNKRKVYWNKEGYLCNDFYQPSVRITSYSRISKGKAKNNYLIGVYDTTIKELLESLDNLSCLRRNYYKQKKITSYLKIEYRNYNK